MLQEVIEHAKILKGCEYKTHQGSELAKYLYELYYSGKRGESSTAYTYGGKLFTIVVGLRDGNIETFEIYLYKNDIYLIHGCWEHPYNCCGGVIITPKDLLNIITMIVW